GPRRRPPDGRRRRPCPTSGDEEVRRQAPPGAGRVGEGEWIPPSMSGSLRMIRRRMSFLEKLAAASRSRDSIICVGLDPEPDLIPSALGRGPQAAVRFLRRIVRATSEYACAYKPNLAFYERYGA